MSSSVAEQQILWGMVLTARPSRIMRRWEQGAQLTLIMFWCCQPKFCILNKCYLSICYHISSWDVQFSTSMLGFVPKFSLPLEKPIPSQLLLLIILSFSLSHPLGPLPQHCQTKYVLLQNICISRVLVSLAAQQRSIVEWWRWAIGAVEVVGSGCSLLGFCRVGSWSIFHSEIASFQLCS